MSAPHDGRSATATTGVWRIAAAGASSIHDSGSVPDQALRSVGLRATRQRRSVLEALRERPDSVTAQELHMELRQAGEPIGLTTVYRTLTALAEAGFLDTFERDGEQAFRRCGGLHHHHLVCETCNRVEEIAADEVERWVGQVADRRGYEVTGHRADIFGICAACR